MITYVKGLVSVVIPTHNRENLIERAIKSALTQTYKDIEVIVVSDGSEDNTHSILERFTSNYSNFYYIEYYPGRGGNYARNQGILRAKGEWIAFLDDDDEWHNNKIEKQMEYIFNNPDVEMVCTGINAIYDKDGTQSIFIPNPKKDSSKDILLKNCIGSTTTVIVKHDILDKVGMFDEELPAMQDYELWIRLCQVTKVGVVEEPCVDYHNLSTNDQVSWNYEKYAKATEYINKKHEKLFLEKLSSKERKYVNSKSMFNIARKAMKANDGKNARQYIYRSLKYKIRLIVVLSWFASFMPFEFTNKIYIFLNRNNK